MKNLTVDKLKKLDACTAAIEAFQAQTERDPIKLIRTMIETKQHLGWANWLITRLITKRQSVQYAVYAASQVLDIFEKEYPDDKRPREAIEAARVWIKRPTKKNRAAAWDASRAASSYAAARASAAAWAASCTADAAYAAASCTAANISSYAAARASVHFAYAAASDAAVNAAYAARANDVSDSDAMLVQILEYGLKLLMGKTWKQLVFFWRNNE